MFALDALGVRSCQLPIVKLSEGRSRMRGMALMGTLWAATMLGVWAAGAWTRRHRGVRDPRRRGARLRGRRVPARGDPHAAQRRPRAAAARRPLHGRREHLVADRLDHRPGRRRLPPAAPAAPALADRGGSQSRLRRSGARARAAAARSGAPDAAGRTGFVANSGERVAFPGHARDRRPPQYRCPACRASVRAALLRDARSRRAPRPR